MSLMKSHKKFAHRLLEENKKYPDYIRNTRCATISCPEIGNLKFHKKAVYTYFTKF